MTTPKKLKIAYRVIDCPACGGSGRKGDYQCRRCHGEGKLFVQVFVDDDEEPHA